MYVLLIVAAVLVVGAWLVHRHVNTLARLQVTDGRIEVVSGELRGRVLADVKAAIRLSGFRDGTVTISRGPVVRTSPRSEGLEQRLRNTLGTHTVGQLHTQGDGWKREANRMGGWLALTGLVSALLRRFR